MNYIHGPNLFGNQDVTEHDEGAWISIGDLIFDIIFYSERALKPDNSRRRGRAFKQ